jgi:ABC-type branched-subunit amino acid transport system substrate-binding protein
MRKIILLLITVVICGLWIASAMGFVPVIASILSTIASIVGMYVVLPPAYQIFGSGFSAKIMILAFFIICFLLLLGVVIFYIVIPYVKDHYFTASLCNAAQEYGITVNEAADKELIGLSFGCSAFDTTLPGRKDGALKLKAAQALNDGQVTNAESLLTEALKRDPEDAEAAIYLEDLHIIDKNDPASTLILVVGTTFTKASIGDGRDNLQGAYVAQHENNSYCGFDIPNCPQVLLLIANAGIDADSGTTQVAQQIVMAAQANLKIGHIVGVMGWPLSVYTKSALPILADAHIPMVSPTSSDARLSGHYFFRVAPTSQDEANAAVSYAVNQLHVKSVAIFYDKKEPFSSDLRDAFKSAISQKNVAILDEEDLGSNVNHLPALLQNALSTHPDLIYYAGHAAQAADLFQGTPACAPNPPDCPWIMGSNSLYVLLNSNGYPPATKGRLYFTAYAFPDAFSFNGSGPDSPRFFSEYCSDFDPNDPNATRDCTKENFVRYGSTRAEGDVIISYDTMQIFMEAMKGAKSSLVTNDTVETALQTVSPFQGSSGCISLVGGGTVRKTVFLLFINAQGRTQMAKDYTILNLKCQ